MGYNVVWSCNTRIPVRPEAAQQNLPAALPNAEPLLVSSECFDVFNDPTGRKIPADRRSVAYRFHFLALKAEEVDTVHQKVLEALTNKAGGEFW